MLDNPWATETASDRPDAVWRTHAPSSEIEPHWEAAREEEDTRAVLPERLDSLLRHCQQVSQEIWPASETSNEGDWRSGFDDLADITALLAQLLPTDPTLPPTVQFPATATARAMNEALKLTRHLPASASSPLSRMLASKGSLEWQNSIKTKQDVFPDTARVGWRVLEKADHLSTLEESKSKKATGGFLSFWNRRASAIQAAPPETPTERSSSPARSSLESVKSVPHPPSSPATSPPKPSTPAVPPSTDSCPTVVATAPAPSAVSRFLNRFSRTKGTQHSALALSSDDLEFLSDIVPSASDLPDEGISDSPLDVLTGASSLSPLLSKLPPPIPPPPKQPIPSTRLSPALVLGTSNGAGMIGSAPTAFQAGGGNNTPNVPLLAPPLSPKPTVSFSLTQSPSSLKDVATPTIAFRQSSTPPIPQRLQSSSQLNSQPQPFLALSPLQKVSPLSIPPLLPPPPISPPQTPRPSALSSGHSSTMQHSDNSFSHDPYESDDEFTAFTSFPPPAPAPFPSLNLSSPQRFPSPPSPPPRRTYERTHYPSSSSTSSILSPASQSSVDQLCSTKPPISASSDSFDDFISPPSAARGESNKYISSPPPLPAKSRQPPRIDTHSSRVHHAHNPSQTFSSPGVHTNLMTGVPSVPLASGTEHQRTLALVNHAAAREGILWPNSPESDEPGVRATPPPASSSTSPLVGEENFDLLGDTLGGVLDALPAPLSMAGPTGMDSVGALHAPSGIMGRPGKGLGLRNQLQPSPPPMLSKSAPILSSSSLGTVTPSTATNTGSLQPAKPKQIGGLSAQDLSFFEGL